MLIVYVFVELIIEALYYTKDYLIFGTHTHHTFYVQWMPYSFVWLYLIKYVAHAQIYVDQTQKDFWVF